MDETNENKIESKLNWHRLFGLALTDFFTNTPYEVELEKELTLQKQFIDVTIIKKNSDQVLTEVPDGLENLNDFNLLSYKSHQESLNAWAIEELIEYYVLYRKLISETHKKLIDTDKFCLYAISTRYPNKFFSQIKVKQIHNGIYEFKPVSKTIRIIVLKEILDKPNNAIWNLFSAITDKVKYGESHYKHKIADFKSMMNNLFIKYQLEGIIMPYTINDFKLDSLLHIINALSPEQRENFFKLLSSEEKNVFLKQLSPNEKEDFFKLLSSEEKNIFLKQLSPEEKKDFFKQLSPNEKEDFLNELSPEEILNHLSLDKIEEYLNKLKEKK